MNRRFLVALLIVCFTPLALSQTAAPPQLQKRPPAAPGSRDASGKKIGRIILDATVTDSAGKPVAGLTQSDFTFLDNHQPAKIASFRSVDGAATASDPVQVILLIDGMNNSFQNVAAERDQIDKYLSRDNGQLFVPMSIALLSDTGLKINQPTRDGNILIAELKKMPVPVNTINVAMGGEGAIQRFQLSLKVLTQLLAYEGTRPGRKLLLWIGPGWPMLAGIHFGVSERDKHSDWGSIVSLSTDLRETRTTLYAVDLQHSENSTAHNVFYQNFLKPVTNAKGADSGNLALPVLAVQSGGRVLNASNDLAGEIASCVDDAHTYYTFTLPIFLSNTVDDYHPLEVKVGRAGLAARTNTGFYNQPYAGMALPQPQASVTTTLHTEGRLVVTDVVVLDRHGFSVQGLNAGNFQLPGTKECVLALLWISPAGPALRRSRLYPDDAHRPRRHRHRRSNHSHAGEH
ncbi:MAG TPA: VWA domain-containing protein [Silvibacterium sp.]|nr:VWA domain-containing protein [Silvibacterium sp.]